jgi:integrase
MTQAENWLPIGEATKLANVSSVQWLHKLIKKGELPAYYEQRGQLKYWYVDANSERFQKLLNRNDPEAQQKAIRTNHPIDWDEWKAMCQRGEELVNKTCTERTVENYRYNIDKFFETHKALSRDTLRAALKFYEDKEIPKKRDYFWSKNAVFFALLTVAKYYVHKGYETPEFVKGLEHLRPIQKVKNRSVRWYEAEIIQETAMKVQTAKTKRNAAAYSEYNAVLNTALVYTALYTAARSSEIAEIRLGDINWREETIQIHGKGGKIRPVGISKTLKQALRAWLAKRPNYAKADHLFVDERFGHPMKPDYIHKRIKRAGNWMKITLAPHDIRRSALTWYLTEKGLDLATVRDIAGHADFKTTNKYSQPPTKRVVEAMKAL